MNKLLSILLGSAALLSSFPVAACDAGRGSTAPIVVFAPPGIVTDVPLNYADCVTPASVTITVSTKASVKYFYVRVKDLNTGYEYLQPTHAQYSTTLTFADIPAAGHTLIVELFNGSRGTRLNVNISVR